MFTVQVFSNCVFRISGLGFMMEVSNVFGGQHCFAQGFIVQFLSMFRVEQFSGSGLQVSSSSLLLSSPELSDTKVYDPQIRALLGTASHFFKVVLLKLRTGRAPT